MSSRDLSPDQQALLELVLRRGRTYEQLAPTLQLDRDEVRERALAAVDVLSPEAPPDAGSHDLDLVVDHLLGQGTPAGKDGLRGLLAREPALARWAEQVATALEGLAPGCVPALPETRSAPEAPPRRRPSRRALLLGGAGLAIAAAIALVLVLSGGDGSDDRAAAPTTSTAATTTPSALAQLELRRASGAPKDAVGLAIVTAPVGSSQQPGLQIAAQGLSSSGTHAVWLYASKTKASPLGLLARTADGQLGGVLDALPADWADYSRVVITRERTETPSRPGTIVLSASLT